MLVEIRHSDQLEPQTSLKKLLVPTPGIEPGTY
jgi:hypothetical protein